VAGYSGKPYLAQGFAALERDMADKLRRLRASTKNLRKYLIVWLIAIACAFCGCAWILDNTVLRVLFSVFLLLAPRGICSRRMAERHRQKIEDQLADAMVTLAKRRACGPLAAAIARNSGRAMPETDSMPSSIKSWPNTTWASRWSARWSRPRNGQKRNSRSSRRR